jgi:tape measure domain-containing protein
MDGSTIGRLQVEITAMTKGFSREIDGVKGKLSELEGAGGKASQGLFDGLERVGKVGATALKVGVVGAIAAITASIPGAVKRIDTLNNAPKILRNLGYAANDSEAAMKKLDLGIRGLPTSLDEATSSLVAIASASGRSIDEATDLTLAFNNMALAGGKGPAEAQRAFVQFTQAVGRGKMGMQEFNTLSEVMPAQLSHVAQSLLGPSANMSTLRDALSEGTVTMEQFMDEIVHLDKNGGQGFASFSVQAKDATAGIATGFANMRIGITRGVAAIMTAIGAANITDALGKIGAAFGTVLRGVASLIEFVAAHSNIFAPIAVGIASVVAFMTAWYVATQAVIKVKAVLAALLAANPLGLLILAIAAVVAGLIYLWNTSEGFRGFFINMWDSIVAAIQPVVTAFNTHLLPILKTVRDFVVNQFKAAWDDLRQSFETIRNTLQPYIEQMKGPLMSILKAVGIAIAVSFIAPLVILVAGIGAVIVVIGVVVSVIARLIGWLSTLYSKLVEVASVVTGTVVNGFRNGWNAIAGVWSRAAGFFAGIASSVRNAFSGVPAAFRGVFSNAWAAVRLIWGSVASWFGNIDLAGAGRKMIQSLINGITSMVGKAKEAAGNVVGAIRDFFPFSPAKEGPLSGKGYTTHSGKALMQDFADAVKKQGPYLKKTMDSAIPDLRVPSIQQLEGKIGSAISGPELTDANTRQIPVNVNIDGDRLLSFVIDGVNGRAFMSNRTVFDL